MPGAVLDTGFFLAISQRGRFDRRYARRLLRRASQRQYDFHISALALAECADHLSHSQPRLPLNAWLHSVEVQTFIEVSSSVTIHPANARSLLTAATMKRDYINSTPRHEPTLTDAATAELADVLHAELLVTDDLRDFSRLLPDFDGEILSPAELIHALGG